MMIPKIIHYCWFGGNKMPNDFQKYINTWKKYCPDYEIKCWDESNFDIESNKFVSEAYKTKNWAFVSDYVRLKVVYEYGGIYLDTDVELLRNFDELLKNDLFLPIQQNGCYINNGLCFGAKKHNKIVKELLNEYDQLSFDNNIKSSLACPYIITNMLTKYGYKRENCNQLLNKNIMIYSSKYFDPICPDTNVNLLCKESFSIHHYSATWMSKSTIIKRKICNFIGQDRINKIKKILRK